LYRPLNLRDTPIIFTTLTDAEITKYAANAFLAMKITFINEIADLCEKVAGDVQSVARAIGLDNRIGSKFLHPGPGYGGSCFPKDTRAMAAIGRRYGSPLRLVETTVQVNNERIASLNTRVKEACGGSISHSVVGILGIAFKPNTDDCRESASLTLIADLQREGATIRAHDPQAVKGAQEVLSDVTWCDTPYEVAAGADILVILTEWNEYRALDLEAIRDGMRRCTIFDMRNIYRHDEMAARGIRYYSIGRQPVGLS
jgi:UDPglucose 6-dehydrogenase